MENELEGLLEALTGGKLSTPIKLHRKEVERGESLITNILAHLNGLLGQDELTKEQLELFSLLLQAYEIFQRKHT